MQFHPGLKLWSTNANLLPQAVEIICKDLFHYIELTPVPCTDIEPFLSYDIPYVIHATTERHGLNIADPEKIEYNLRIIGECIEWTDKLNGKYIILHPGFGEIENAIQFLDNIDDSRVIIENMPKVGINGEKMIGSNPDEMKALMDTGDFGFCFDINHAIKAAISEKSDYKSRLQDYSKLEPSMFHISDGSLNEEVDEHLQFGNGNYDIRYIKKFIETFLPDKEITIEISRIRDFFEDDISNLIYFKKT